RSRTKAARVRVASGPSSRLSGGRPSVRALLALVGEILEEDDVVCQARAAFPVGPLEAVAAGAQLGGDDGLAGLGGVPQGRAEAEVVPEDPGAGGSARAA